MSNGITRRDWLKLIGGSAVGLMLTPIPWKVLDETAKWTQNWSWTPIPPKGRINFKYTTCTLCPMACGVRARCVESQPVSLMGIPGHPVSGGALCEMGLGGHLLPYHPSRLLQPYKRVKDGGDIKTIGVSYEETIKAISEAITSTGKGSGSVAILDMQPGRSISYVYRRFLAEAPNGLYINPHTIDGIPPHIARTVLHSKNDFFGFDVENTRTILSFGTPVLDGWGTLGQFSKIVRNRRGDGNNRLKIIQVESVHSRTAKLADEWIAIRPGAEAAFALALANVIMKENLCDVRRIRTNVPGLENTSLTMSRSSTASRYPFLELAKGSSPEIVSEQTGISADKIVGVARELAARKPSLILSGGDPGTGPFGSEEETIFMDLNILLGAVGTKGGLVARNEIPEPFKEKAKLATETQLAEVPDSSIKVLIMDGAESGNAIPWTLIQRKLSPNNPVVVGLTSHLVGVVRHADYLLPSAGYLESYTDSPSPAGASVASYSISTPILTAPKQVIEPLNFIKIIAATTHSKSENGIQALTTARLLRNRVEKIFKEKKGLVFDASTGNTTKLASVASSDQLINILSNGGCWIDDTEANFSRPRYSSLGENENVERIIASANQNSSESTLVLLPYGTRGAESIGQTHAEMTKLYRESNVRETANIATINPKTGKDRRLNDGGKAIIKTDDGSAEVKVRFDASVMPGVIQVAVGPLSASFDHTETLSRKSILEICKIESNSTWRTTKADIIPA